MFHPQHYREQDCVQEPARAAVPKPTEQCERRHRQKGNPPDPLMGLFAKHRKDAMSPVELTYRH